jgi:hypothetical protein
MAGRGAGPLILVLLAALLLPVGSARAAFGFESAEFSIFSAPPPGAEPGAVGPPQLQAGSHPYEARFAFALNRTTDAGGETMPDETLKDLEVELPPGLIGNPLGVPQCLAEEFQDSALFEQGCPAAAQIGTMKLETTLADVTVPVFNLEPPPEKTAQFGVFALLAPIVMDASVRSDGEYGLKVTMRNLPQFLPLLGGVLNLWGVPADARHDTLRGTCLGFEGGSTGECPASVSRRPFLTLPVRCGRSPVARFRMDSWERPGELVSRSVLPLDAEGGRSALEGCDKLDFSPQIGVRPESRAADSPAGVAIDLSLPQSENPDGLAEAQPRSIALALPAGLSLNPAAGDGLDSCSLEEIALESPAQPHCPGSSRIGSFAIDSPLIADPLRGSIYLATPRENPFGTMLATYIVATGGGTLIKLPGRIDADGDDGRLTVRLEGLPQLPFSTFGLQFDGGPRAPLALPARCGTYTTSARLGAYSDPASVEPTVLAGSFAVDQRCEGGFSPSFLGGATGSAAGHRTGLTLRLARGEGEEDIGRFSTVLPAGLLPMLADLASCPEPQAEVANCPAASRIGAVNVAAGAGSHPFVFTGHAYLTGPYKGAPFGLAIVVPAVAGPFDLGTVVVRAEVLVDPRSARLTIATDPLPRILQGIPLRIRSFELATVERPGLFVAPTSCDREEVSARALGGAGGSAATATPFFVAGCSDLRFSPRVSAAAGMRAGRRGGVGLRLEIRNPLDFQTNLRSITVGFPRQLSPRLSTIQGACPAATFAADPGLCPRTAVIGNAEVRTPIFESILEGSAYLVSRGAEALPRIVLVLGTRGTTFELFGSLHVSRQGATSATFAAMPDAPISKFSLALPKGPHSAFGANVLGGERGTLCGRRLTMPTTLTGYNRRRAKFTVRVAITGCRDER